jgi:hypothetical protein
LYTADPVLALRHEPQAGRSRQDPAKSKEARERFEQLDADVRRRQQFPHAHAEQHWPGRRRWVAIRLPVAVAARLDRLAASRFAGNRTKAVTHAVERATSAPELEAAMGAAADSVAGLAETLELLSASARAGSVTAQRELLSLHERLVAAGEGDDGS